MSHSSLRSRRLEVAGERENGRARGRHARGEGAPARKAPENRSNSHSGASSPLACLLLARPFFLVPTTSKRLLRRLVTQLFTRKSPWQLLNKTQIFYRISQNLSCRTAFLKAGNVLRDLKVSEILFQVMDAKYFTEFLP